ncbi:FG-GAP repeat domain-containing protein, partial [Nostoc sp.]|uniref:FG-GAP repeat domain-containing protein n=1 Tax=Nostoc sp. TaxID=1180 RepID=UPI002FF8151A
MPFDFNGDGKDDFIRQEKGAYAVDDLLTAQVYLSNGDGTFSSQLLTYFTIDSGDLTNLIVGDYNGDGKDDFIRQEKGAYAVDDLLTAQVYLSNGDGTFSSQPLTDSTIDSGDLTNLIVGDYNGDGKDDFIRQEKGAYAVDDLLTAQVYLSNGDGTFSSQPLTDSTID